MASRAASTEEVASPSEPSPPAFETAAASTGVPAEAIGAWMIGCSIPSSWVSSVRGHTGGTSLVQPGRAARGVAPAAPGCGSIGLSEDAMKLSEVLDHCRAQPEATEGYPFRPGVLVFKVPGQDLRDRHGGGPPAPGEREV